MEGGLTCGLAVRKGTGRDSEGHQGSRTGRSCLSLSFFMTSSPCRPIFFGRMEKEENVSLLDLSSTVQLDFLHSHLSQLCVPIALEAGGGLFCMCFTSIKTCSLILWILMLNIK